MNINLKTQTRNFAAIVTQLAIKYKQAFVRDNPRPGGVS